MSAFFIVFFQKMDYIRFMQIKRILFFQIVIIISFYYQASATHIVGGEMNYKFLGNDKYEIRLTVYRDCYVGVPPFDNPATVGIFNRNNQLLQTLQMTYRGLDTLPPTINDPCMIPPLDFCYEVTTYIDTVTLPPIVGGYQLSYQRCCRNQNILNIINPECVGATYYASIPGSEVVSQNSNPVFKNWPPPFVCANKPWIFDHSAIDYDGDSLVYELFYPYDGLNGYCPIIGNIAPSTGVSCGAVPASCTATPVPPPFVNFQWKPPYSTNDMLGGVPMAVNPQTGLVTATPNLQGYFVIGVKVKEYRNGILISETLRDFQLIVKPCPAIVVAAAQAPNVICGSPLVTFSNNSVGNNLGFSWNFGDPNTTTDTSSAASPSYNYPGTGTYTATMIAFDATKPLCNDTVRAEINISSSFTAQYTYTIVPCLQNVVNFSGFVESPQGTTPIWYWNFGDGTTSNIQNPTHTFPSSGTYPITLISSVPNSIGCYDTLTTQLVTGEVFIPNTFTPNGDGHNDVFKVRSPSFQFFYLAVYNRWGELVYETKNVTEGWDGNYKGKPSDPGVFGYYMTAKCNENDKEIFKKGNVTLIR